MAERPTFSPFWHRVRAMKPRLRPHTQITRQLYRGRRWHVVHDPSSNQYYRLSPVAHEFVGLLDGSRTVEDVWNITLAKHGDAAPTQNEVIQLLSQLYNANLLSADAAPETEQLLRRGRERLKKKATQQAIGIMYFRIRIFNPDRMLAWIEPVLRPILNRVGFIAWCALIITALVMLLPNWQALTEGFGSTIAPSNWPWLIVVFIVTKAIHETGHGVICKRFGGHIPEFGFMLLVLFPAPYVDASSAWAFDNKWRRIAVGAGGMIFELAVAAVAAFVWLSTQDGSLTKQIAYNVIFTASVSTILFNANPLMRFDGYYILSDLLEVPNLMQRSTNLLKYYFKRYAFGMENEVPPTTLPGEYAILLTYGILALAYRVFLFISITLYVMGKMFALGLVLAIWTAAMWFFLPVGKLTHWLASSPQLVEKRSRAIYATIGMIVLGVVAFGLIPFDDHRRAVGVVQSETEPAVFVTVEGFVTEVHVRPGDTVREGDPILTAQSPERSAELALALAELAEYESRERQLLMNSPAGAQVARDRIAALETQAEHHRTKLTELIVRAPHDGVIVGQDPLALLGKYAEPGTAICEVVDPSQLRIAAALGQSEAAWHFQLGSDNYTAQARLVSEPAHSVDAIPTRVIDSGQTQLPHAALGFAGGGQIDPAAAARSGLQAKQAQFVMYLAPQLDTSDDGTTYWTGAPGERVRLRFTLPPKPLLVQWADRLHKMIQGKVVL